jgi:hypothetical protein
MEVGQGPKVAYIPHENPQFNTVGYGTQNRLKSGSGAVTSSIDSFDKTAAPQPKGKPRNMTKSKVMVSESESIDAQGNVVKTITRTTIEPDGTKRVEKEVVDPSKTTKRTFGGYK